MNDTTGNKRKQILYNEFRSNRNVAWINEKYLQAVIGYLLVENKVASDTLLRLFGLDATSEPKIIQTPSTPHKGLGTNADKVIITESELCFLETKVRGGKLRNAQRVCYAHHFIRSIHTAMAKGINVAGLKNVFLLICDEGDKTRLSESFPSAGKVETIKRRDEHWEFRFNKIGDSSSFTMTVDASGTDPQLARGVEPSLLLRELVVNVQPLTWQDIEACLGRELVMPVKFTDSEQ